MDNWWTRAACKGMPVDVFFPRKGERAPDAERACATCPVAGDCYTDAATHGAYGIWGGARWNNGQPGRSIEGTGISYPAETRAAAIDLYQRIRNHHRTETAALQAVAQQLELRDPATVRKWVTGTVPASVRKPQTAKHRTPEERAQALAMLHRIRDQHPTMKAAAQVVARAFGVHFATVCGWHEKAQTEQQQQVGTAA